MVLSVSFISCVNFSELMIMQAMKFFINNTDARTGEEPWAAVHMFALLYGI